MFCRPRTDRCPIRTRFRFHQTIPGKSTVDYRVTRDHDLTYSIILGESPIMVIIGPSSCKLISHKEMWVFGFVSRRIDGGGKGCRSPPGRGWCEAIYVASTMKQRARKVAPTSFPDHPEIKAGTPQETRKLPLFRLELF